MSSGHRIKVSDDFDLKDGKLVVNEARVKAKKPVCARFSKRKDRVRAVKPSAVGQGRLI